jgi:LacI family gluconate utilization system Gnt-I transcriptional repressor
MRFSLAPLPCAGENATGTTKMSSTGKQTTPSGGSRGRRTGLPRLADVADRAGVAKITASRVLRQAGPVAAETRARVERAMHELGYIPNIIASNLASNRTGVIAAITPGFASPLIRDLFQGLSDVVHPEGYHILFGVAGYGQGEEDALVRALLARRPDALVLSRTRHSPATTSLLRKSGIPIVEVGQLTRRPIDMAVGFSNRAAAREVVRHMIERGYRRVAMISELQEESGRAMARRRGYADALAKAGLSFDPALLVEVRTELAEGARAIRRLRETSPAPDAVFCSDDLLALGALFECQHQRWRVPEDIAIAGFGDLEYAEQACPSITTVKVDRTGMGRLAGEMLLSALRGNPPAIRSVDIEFTLIPRDSTSR